jgi:cytochrome P450
MPERNLQFAYRFRSLSRLVVELIQRRRTGNEEHHDFVAMLMGARDKETGASMSDRELVDEILTLIVAGHETTAAAINACWYLLSQHPEAELELHAEVDAVPVHSCPSYRDTEDLAVTQRVLHETMRLYPPGWLLSRRAIGPDRLGGYDLPAGTVVLLAPYLVHRHPRHWDAPEEFRPDRFRPEAVDRRHKYAYIPFAVGPRHCIGENVAMFEMIIHVAMVARRFRMRCLAEDPPEFEASINLRTRHHLRYRLEAR